MFDLGSPVYIDLKMWVNWYTKQNSETSSVVVGLYSIYINVRILFDLRRKSQFDLYLDEIYNRLNVRSYRSDANFQPILLFPHI